MLGIVAGILQRKEEHFFHKTAVDCIGNVAHIDDIADDIIVNNVVGALCKVCGGIMDSIIEGCRSRLHVKYI